MTTVTVAIPTLNGSERLERCLKSIAMCTTLDETVRVVVRDDGSEAEELQKVKAVMERMTASIPGLTLLLDGEREQHALGEQRAVGELEVGAHSLGVDGHVLHERDGRVLGEALAGDAPPLRSLELKHLTARRDLGNGQTWAQYLNVSEVNGVQYFDEGNGSQVPGH